MNRRKKRPLPTLIVKAGTPAFDAWVKHFRATGMSDRAAFCERQGLAIVYSEFPRQPGTKPAPITNRIVGERE
jgi:hypothetical protein